jgi:hypothetical protein
MKQLVFKAALLGVLTVLAAGISGEPGRAVLPVAEAKEESGVEVKVYVLNPEGEPISTAVVRHPQEMDRHRVNTQDGSWKATSLYLPDGSELRFTAGMDLDLEVSAPGFQTELIVYQVRKRKNVVQVTLQPIEMIDDSLEEPIITFKQDKPRETTDAP